MDNASMIQRLQKYCLNHKAIVESGVIKGINFETEDVVLEKHGILRQLPLDLLEDGVFNFDEFMVVSETDLTKYDIRVGYQGVEWGPDNKIIEMPRNLKELLDVNPGYQYEKMMYILNNLNDSLDKPYEDKTEIIYNALVTVHNIQCECQRRNIEYNRDMLLGYDPLGNKIDK